TTIEAHNALGNGWAHNVTRRTDTTYDFAGKPVLVRTGTSPGNATIGTTGQPYGKVLDTVQRYDALGRVLETVAAVRTPAERRSTFRSDAADNRLAPRGPDGVWPVSAYNRLNQRTDLFRNANTYVAPTRYDRRATFAYDTVGYLREQTVGLSTTLPQRPVR